MTYWFKSRIFVIGAIVAIMAGIQFFNASTGYALNDWGILPRQKEGLAGILCSEWLHTSWGHLWGNMLAFVPLAFLVSLRSVRYFVLASIVIILTSGMITWLTGRPSYHVGASGWIFGLWGLVLGLAWFYRSLIDLVVALMVLIYFGGMVYELLPHGYISFEGHWGGVIAGVLFAWLTARRVLRKPNRQAAWRRKLL